MHALLQHDFPGEHGIDVLDGEFRPVDEFDNVVTHEVHVPFREHFERAVMEERSEEIRIGGTDALDLVGLDSIDIRVHSFLIDEHDPSFDDDVEIHFQIDNQMDEPPDKEKLHEDADNVENREFEIPIREEEYMHHVDHDYQQENQKIRLELVETSRKGIIAAFESDNQVFRMHDFRIAPVVFAEIPYVPEAGIQRSDDVQSYENGEHYPECRIRFVEMFDDEIDVQGSDPPERNHPKKGCEPVQPGSFDKQNRAVSFLLEPFHHLHVPAYEEGFEEELIEPFEIEHAGSIPRLRFPSNFSKR